MTIEEYIKEQRERVDNMTLAQARQIVANHYGHDDMRIECEKAVKMLLDCADEKINNGWIPVTERLPKKEGLYLVSVKNDHLRRYSKTCWYSDKNWFARQDVVALVIKLSEEEYKHIREMQFCAPGIRDGKGLLGKILLAIRTGTPLPKGHGRLIDEDLLKDQFPIWVDNFSSYGVNKTISKTPTIIEADKEEV